MRDYSTTTTASVIVDWRPKTKQKKKAAAVILQTTKAGHGQNESALPPCILQTTKRAPRILDGDGRGRTR
jgi:hypothetical protein